jgi:hypothetical protein
MQSQSIDVQQPVPWWRFGHVWLVLAGPLTVIVACFVTAFIAIRHPDPVLAQDYYRRGLNINQTLAQQKALQLAPALETRNHVATPKPDLGGAKP